MKKFIALILIIAAAIVVVPISLKNSQPVTLNYIFDNQELPLSWLIFGSFIIGSLFSLVFFAISGLGWKMRAKGLKKQLDSLIKQCERDEIAKQFKNEQ